MPFVFIIIGVALLVSSVRNTQGDLYALVKGDFAGAGNFIFWAISIMLIGALGYIPNFKGLSVAFLTLVVVVLVLTKGNPNGTGGGFFQKFTQQVNSTTATQVVVNGAQTTSSAVQQVQGPPVTLGNTDLSLPENMFPSPVNQ